MKPPSSTKAAGNPFERYIGAVPAFLNRDEINAWIRELRDEDCAEATTLREAPAQE